MDYTDLHFRQLARLLSKRTWLWTEMVVDNTIIHTDQLDKFLWFPPEQHPIVLQLGGSNPVTLRKAAEKAAPYGYDEVCGRNCTSLEFTCLLSCARCRGPHVKLMQLSCLKRPSADQSQLRVPVRSCCWCWMLWCIHDAAAVACGRLLQGAHALALVPGVRPLLQSASGIRVKHSFVAGNIRGSTWSASVRKVSNWCG